MGVLANWKKVVRVDKIFEILKSVHEGARAHTGYHKLYKDVEQTFSGITRKACMEFIKGCVQCACKKPQRNVAPLTPITSKYFMHRRQLDFVDKPADPDGQYCWIGHYIDHYTKFNFFWPQMNKSADEVAHNLSVHVFSVVGLPSILQHDNGREFRNAAIRETLKLWLGDGDVKIITGRPRHPRTQGLVEQVHDSLHKLLASKRADKPGSGWLEFLYEIQYSLNTQCHSSIKMTPFEAVFGQKANDGICVGLQATDEFIDEKTVEYMFETDGDLMTCAQTENETDSQTENKTDSQTENETDSQAENETVSQTENETDSQTDAETDSQTDAETDLQTEAVTDSQTDAETDLQTEAVTDSQTDAETDLQTEAVTDSQTDAETDLQTEAVTDSQTDAETDSQTVAVTDSQTVAVTDSQTVAVTDLQTGTVQPTRKRRRTETSEISTETYDVTDYRRTQDELMAVDDFMILNDIIADPPEDSNCTMTTDK
ncbi:unnamed protein product [Mytilus coruscus]|uniref:Integrase catalytic domain-containing protein n=1 Tax=Mytilus coruscus TaxID=42192 RepID=A0A6J8EV92_MYTCO|nr:unnamed protein product [Mytilus coruscus]